VAKGQSSQTIKENNFKTNKKIALRCKSYDPGSAFLGLKVNTKRIAKTAVIAISSRITLLISTIEIKRLDFSDSLFKGRQSSEYPNDIGYTSPYIDFHGT
jgi:hypothetical protein